MARDQWYPAHGETGVVGRFEFDETLPDIVKSRAADEFVPLRVTILRAKIIGDQDNTPILMNAENAQSLIKRFPEAWKAFNGEEVKLDGTPLSDLVTVNADGRETRLNEDKILDFRLNGCMTVEQLAVMSDAICEKVGFGTRKLRAEAQAMLAKKQQMTMAAAMAIVNAQPAAPAEAPEPVKRKAGRPRKSDENVAA
jgi:hypothetical protein